MSQLVLCIGAPRSGTTWLYSNIRKTENIYVPPVKEVRYFVGFRSPEGIRSTYDNRIEDYTAEEDKVFLEKWLHLKAGDNDAYLDAMLNSSNKDISMDISPIYCVATPKQVEKIKNIVGEDTKILYFLRNPVDREYSQANLHFHMHGTWLDQVAPLSNYLELLQEESQVRRSDYLDVLNSWTEHFDEKHFQVVFYDDLRMNPASTFESILDFIGCKETSLENDQSIKAKVGSSANAKFQTAPIELKTFLAARNLSKLKALADRYPKPCKSWYDDAVALVNG